MISGTNLVLLYLTSVETFQIHTPSLIDFVESYFFLEQSYELQLIKVCNEKRLPVKTHIDVDFWYYIIISKFRKILDKEPVWSHIPQDLRTKNKHSEHRGVIESHLLWLLSHIKNTDSAETCSCLTACTS